MKKKNLLLGLGLALFGTVAQAQNGLENIIVEKYYISNAADAAGSLGTLPVGSVTYRVYADMLPGYKFQALYGDVNHALKVSTTTSFFNNTDRGSMKPNSIASSQLKNNTVALDSWFSVGASADDQFGVLKSEDNGVENLVLANTLLKNNAAKMGIALTTQDGNIVGGVPEDVTFVYPAGAANPFSIFGAVSQAGSSIVLNDHAVSALNGATGPNSATNKVLLGQFTTDGIFRFEFNIQIGTPDGGTQNYVASTPLSGEITIPSLTLEPNIPPVVSITSPSNLAQIITGTAMTLTANASDPDLTGAITKVEFYLDNALLFTDVTAPYEASYTAIAGPHSLYAIATDNSADADQTTSTTVNFSVANNQAPTVSVSAATTAIVGDVVTITATPNDVDGTVTEVEFFVDNVSIGSVSSAPYTKTWTSIVGAHTFKAIAKDNLLLTGTSSIANITVAANTPPTAVITSTSPSVNIMAPAVVTINATASDNDGTLTSVQFFVNGSLLGTGTREGSTDKYSFDWTSVIGQANITVKSTDNKGAVTTSSTVTLEINDPAALPYRIVPVTQFCNLPKFNMAVAASLTNNVSNVIGYDVVLNYDKNKVNPTGVIVVNNALIDPTLVETSNTIDAVNGTIRVVVAFKAGTPGNTRFTGTGNIFTVEFAKTGTFGSVDETVISGSFLQESYITGVVVKSVKEGKAITEKNYFLNGSLRFWSDNSPIKYDAALPNDYLTTKVYGTDVSTGIVNTSLLNVSPDLSGNFKSDLRNGLGLNIDRDIANTTDVFTVVNAADVTIVNSILLGSASLTPSVYQMIASDVNMDGVISAGDISQIRQRGTKNIDEFRQAWNYTNAGVSDGRPSKDWIFVDSLRIKNNPAYQISATYPANDATGFSKSKVPVTPFSLPATVSDYANCPAATVEVYRGIMIGDVDGNYDFINKDGILKSSLSDENKIIFDFTRAIVNGNSVDVPVSIVSTEDVKALDFAIKFNENELTFNDVVSNSSKIEAFNFFNTDDRTMRFTSNNFSNFALNTEVVNVRLNLSNGKIKAEDFTSVMGMLNGKQVKVELKEKASGLTVNAAANSVRIFPNPTNGLLNIVANENSTVEITDLTGKQVMFVFNLNANVKQEINVSDFSNGMYIVKVYNENFSSVERIVVNK